MVILDEEEDLVSKDPSKQGRTETEYEDVKTDHAEEMLPEKRLCYTIRRSTDSLKVSTAGDLFSTAEEFLSTDEEISQKLRNDKSCSKRRFEKILKIIRVGNITKAYQGFEDMLKAFDREDLDTLWSLVKEKFRSVEPTEDMERALWVELKRIYKPDKEDTLWKLQRYMHDPLTWRLYGSCAVHHVFSTRGHYIYMLPEKDYPLTTAVMMLMLGRRL
ncbi:hypothetical protein Tco_1279656 [Tanacetum coccineum]